MTNDEQDQAIDRVIGLFSKVDAWNNVDCVTSFEEFLSKYKNTVWKFRKPERGSADFIHHRDIVELMLENKKREALKSRIDIECGLYDSPRFIPVEYDPYAKPYPKISEFYSILAIRAIQYSDNGYEYLDKSVEEVQMLAYSGDDVAIAMLVAVKVLNWKLD